MLAAKPPAIPASKKPCKPPVLGRIRSAILSGSSSRRVCASAQFSQPYYRQLPNATWLLSFVQDQFYSIHGSDFVIKRGEESKEQAAPSRGKKRRMLATQRPCDKQAEMVHKAVWQAPPMILMLEGAVVDVDVELDGYMQQCKEDAPPPAATTCTGIVSVSPPASSQEEVGKSKQDGIFVTSSSSPRRTKVVGFTCLKCGARNHKAVNPKSFLSGTLVCQCGKCSRKHIVTDHLKLFSLHKLDGSMRNASKGPEVKLSEDDVPASLRNVDMSVLEQSGSELN